MVPHIAWLLAEVCTSARRVCQFWVQISSLFRTDQLMFFCYVWFRSARFSKLVSSRFPVLIQISSLIKADQLVMFSSLGSDQLAVQNRSALLLLQISSGVCMGHETIAALCFLQRNPQNRSTIALREQLRLSACHALSGSGKGLGVA